VVAVVVVLEVAGNPGVAENPIYSIRPPEPRPWYPPGLSVCPEPSLMVPCSGTQENSRKPGCRREPGKGAGRSEPTAGRCR